MVFGLTLAVSVLADNVTVNRARRYTYTVADQETKPR